MGVEKSGVCVVLFGIDWEQLNNEVLVVILVVVC